MAHVLPSRRLPSSNRIVCVSTSAQHVQSMNFEHNYDVFMSSLIEAKAQGSKFHLGSELNVTGHGCLAHFKEPETLKAANEILVKILKNAPIGIAYTVNMPWLHNDVLYNAVVVCLNGQILHVCPKIAMADDGNYREGQFFTPWDSSKGIRETPLPDVLQTVTKKTVTIGRAILSFNGIKVAIEICEEAWRVDSPNIDYYKQGVDIIFNPSASHGQLRKLNKRVKIVCDATEKYGGLYLYANQKGCDGDRAHYDGAAMVSFNGQLLGHTPQSSLTDYDVLTVSANIEEITAMRLGSMSSQDQSAKSILMPVIDIDFSLEADSEHQALTPPTDPTYLEPAQEMAWHMSYYMLCYLLMSGAGGVLLPLSGGADSAASFSVMAVMCERLISDYRSGGKIGENALDKMRKLLKNEAYEPTTPQALNNLITHTCYMGTTNSTDATNSRAGSLAAQGGSYHNVAFIDYIVCVFMWVFVTFISVGRMRGRSPRFEKNGGSKAEDLALQNIQARIRMVFAYMLAQLLPWIRQGNGDFEGGGGGFLLVLGSANMDECLRGYMTKYDCSSADINPIGSMNKKDIVLFLRWTAATYGYSTLQVIVDAVPTAELRPDEKVKGPINTQFGIDEIYDDAGCSIDISKIGERIAPPPMTAELAGGDHDSSQNDEEDMGMSYNDLDWYGKLRMIFKCGPQSMFMKLLNESDPYWRAMTARQIGDKVKKFFKFYAINRHKMSIITPAIHLVNYSPDDNRFDQRPIIVPVNWYTFKHIDAYVTEMEAADAAIVLLGGGAAAADK